MKGTIVVVLAFALGMLVQRHMTYQDGYEVVKCKKIDQRGDTIVVENTMIKIK